MATHPTFRFTAEPVGICAVATGNTISFFVIQPIFLHKYRGDSASSPIPRHLSGNEHIRAERPAISFSWKAV
jgi:hypothetical protein